jgi:hypothetical protein
MEIRNINLLCLGCNLNFNIFKRKPIALPCGHSFCNICIDSSYKVTSYIKCWTCDKKHFNEQNNLNINQLIYIFLVNQKEIIIKKQENLITKFSYYKNTIVKCHQFSICSKTEIETNEIQKNISPLCKKFSTKDNLHKNNSVLFYYFDFIKQIILAVDNIITPTGNSPLFLLSNHSINYLIKIAIILLILIINYFFGKFSLLYEFYLVTTLTYESILVNKLEYSCCLNTCLNRWISFLIYLLINFMVNFTSLNSLIILDNLYNCLTTIYVLLIVGSDSELHFILGQSISLDV